MVMMMMIEYLDFSGHSVFPERRPVLFVILLGVTVQMSYILLLGVYSYFTMVDLRPGRPTMHEFVVWLWVATMWLEELRQVG